jgi:hypothetical protein
MVAAEGRLLWRLSWEHGRSLFKPNLRFKCRGCRIDVFGLLCKGRRPKTRDFAQIGDHALFDQGFPPPGVMAVRTLAVALVLGSFVGSSEVRPGLQVEYLTTREGCRKRAESGDHLMM